MSKIVVKEQGSSADTPPSGYFSVYAKTDGKIYGKNDSGTEYDLTGSQAGMTSFTVAGDGGTPQTIEQANTLTVAGGDAITTTASATDTLTVALDIPSLTADATPDSATDYVVTYDASAMAHKKVLLSDLPTGGGGMTSFSVAADSGTPEVVGDSDTLTIAGGVGLSSTVAATDTVTVNLDVNSLTEDLTPDGAADFIPSYDVSASGHKKILINNLPFGTMDSFSLAGDTGTPQTISDGNTLTIVGGSAIATTANATDTLTIDLSITELSADATPDGATDYVVTYDASAGTNKKVLLNDLPGGGGGMTSFTLAGDAGTPQTIGDGNTLTVAGGSGISTSAGATDTVTVNLDINELTEDTTPDLDADFVATYDASAGANKKVRLDNLLATPSGVQTPNETTDYTTTSTSFVDIDSTDLSITIIASGGDVLIGFVCVVTATNVVHFNIAIDDVTEIIEDGIARKDGGTSSYSTVSFTYLKQGLSAGSHKFEPQWKVISGTGTILAGQQATGNLAMHPHFWVKELM